MSLSLSRSFAQTSIRSITRSTLSATSLHISRSISSPLTLRPVMSSLSSFPTAANSPSTAFSTSSSSSSSVSTLDQPTIQNTIFFLCDIQETFRDKLYSWNSIVATAEFLTKVSKALQIPLLITEQKPFKPTIKECDGSVNPISKVYSKTLFSMLTDEVKADLANSSMFSGRKQIVLFGIEAHVCVMQTTLDLLREGYHVRLVVDGISSGSAIDAGAAMERYRTLAQKASQMGSGSGVLTLTSAESVVFEIIKDASHPVFKSLLPLIKDFGAFKRGLAQPQSKM